MRRVLLCGILACALAQAAPASAQSNNAAHARDLYEDGARLYNLGQYENALRAFEEAYALSGAKPLLFNIAQAHRLAGPAHCERALLAYETYVREDPQASNRVEVEQRIGEMRICSEREHASQVAAQAPHPTPPANPDAAKVQPVPSPDNGRVIQPSAIQPSVTRPSVAPIVLTGVGGVLAVTGGILYWRARVKFDRVKGGCPCPDGEFSGWQAATYTSYALLATGGATLLGGVSWWILDRRHASASSYGIAIDPGGVFMVGAF